MGHQFTVVTSKYSYLTGKKKAALQDQGGVDVRIALTIGSWHRSYLHRVFAFLSFMFTSVLTGLRVEEPEVVVGTSPPIFQALSAWIVATIRGRSFILEVRDL